MKMSVREMIETQIRWNDRCLNGVHFDGFLRCVRKLSIKYQKVLDEYEQ
jgi:hypothetical protein